MDRDRYYVWGGAFPDLEQAFRKPSPDPAVVEDLELHGPFVDEASADRICQERMRARIDICAHRMLVVQKSDEEAGLWASEMLAYALAKDQCLISFDGDAIFISGDVSGRFPETWGGFRVLRG